VLVGVAKIWERWVKKYKEFSQHT